MELGVLGPLQVRQYGLPVAIPGAKPRAILTMLGLHGGSVVSADALVALLWGDEPPRTAIKALQTHISSLRRALGDGFVLTEGTGWTLSTTEIDAVHYKTAAKLGRKALTAGDPTRAVALFDQALALWRGLPELPDSARGSSEKTRWLEGHAALVEDRADALLATGRAAEIVGELESAIAEAPLRERRWGHLMLALYRAGRQGEALGAYKRARSLLAEELGVDPGPELRRLEAAIVAQDASLEVPQSQQLSTVTRAVTFLLTDIEGSTAAWEADADAMAVALARHDEIVEQVVTSRGGRLIKTRGEGDATFSVFDRPSAAAAAAIELQEAIGHEAWQLADPMRIRVALHTGEVEFRDGDYFGRAVNRAARLRSLAAGGQILCSGATAELVIDSIPDDVVLADLGTRRLRNLPRPEHVFELRMETVDVSAPPAAETPMERPALPAVLVGPGPFVGRIRELERLVSAWQSTLAAGTRAVLIAGEPGVGKTRLAGEWSRNAYDQGAIVLYGRCDEDLGAPYQPFAEALRAFVSCVDSNRLRNVRGIEALLPLIPGLADKLPDVAAPPRADPDTERYALFDAVVALLGTASATAPVVLILDDLHWAAKPTLLLLRHLLRFGEEARVQIVGTYRSTDLDRSHPLAAMLADLHRDGTATRLQLSGLDEGDVTAYVAEAGYDDEELGRALATVTGGNPFFLIEALRHVEESGGRWDPSTLPQGVREAVSRRLSRLTAETNKALAAAAVVGSRFAVTLVEQVVGEDLVDAFDEAGKAGIVIEEPGGRYRFNHALVRQSLLAELPSVRRMRLHQRIAGTLEAEAGADDELLAELAYHYFECAWAGNAAKAVEYCRRAADQAMSRVAYEGAAELYDRALHALEELDDELADRDTLQAELLIAHCEALLAAGDVTSAKHAVAQLREVAVDSGRLGAWGVCFDGELSMLTDPERLDEIETAVSVAAEQLAALEDAAGEAKAHTVRAGCLARLGRIGDCETALDQALTAARRAHEHSRVNAVLAGAPLAALWGPNPVPRAGGRCLDVVRLLRITTGSPLVEATSTRCQAVLDAFRGRAAEGRRLIESARRTLTELGLRHALLEVDQFAGIIELVSDDAVAAEPYLRRAYEGFRRMGLDTDTADTAALLARACLALDRDAEADELCSVSERLAGHGSKASIAWRSVRAQLLARAGDHDRAKEVAEEAVSLAAVTDALVDHGDACLALATVLRIAGNKAGTRAAAEQAVALYDRKGAAALTEKARKVLGSHETPRPNDVERPAVELTNACVDVGRRVMRAIQLKAWDEFESLFVPGTAVESRRRIVGFTLDDLPGGDWVRHSRRLFEASGNVRVTQSVVAVRGERLALSRLFVGSTDVSPGAPQDEFLQIYGIDDSGRVSRQVWFDADDIDAALTEFDAIHARSGTVDERTLLANAASRADDRFNSICARKQWEQFASLIAEDVRVKDRRRGLHTEFRGRAKLLAESQTIGDLGTESVTTQVLAVRGERLALLRALFLGQDTQPDAFRTEMLRVVEVDTHERIVAIVVFEAGDLDGAITELDTRYSAGEAEPFVQVWSTVTELTAAFNRHDFSAVNCPSTDHRRLTRYAPGELTPAALTQSEFTADLHSYIEVVHRLSDHGAVITNRSHGVAQEGFEAEWRVINILVIDDGELKRYELFDETDVEAALRRFDQLAYPTTRLDNSASHMFRRVQKCFANREWDAAKALMSDDVLFDDRRRVVNSEVRRGREATIANMQAGARLGVKDIGSVVLATRGDNLALLRTRYSASNAKPEDFHMEDLTVVEIDTTGQVRSGVIFDLDDFASAMAELEARYIKGEAAHCARTWKVIAEGYAGLNRSELAPTTPDWVNVDRRRFAPIAAGRLGAYIRVNQDETPEVRIYAEAVHRISELGAVVTRAVSGTSREGFYAEWREIDLLTVKGELLSRCEIFDEADLDVALAEFDELDDPRPRLENAASRTAERFQLHLARRDWDTLRASLTDESLIEDRRQVVSAPSIRGEDDEIANLHAMADLGLTDVSSTVIAIRGERLALRRTRFSADDLHTDVLDVVEVDRDGHLVSYVGFDPEDFDAAFEELESRYLAGEAARHAQTWTVVSGVFASLARHEVPPSAPDWLTIDHRRGTPLAGTDLGAVVASIWDVTPDLQSHIETVHRLDDHGALCMQVSRGTTPDGFPAEWRMLNLMTVDGSLVSGCELFDEDDLQAAFARFESLNRREAQLENTASRAGKQFQARFAAEDWDAMAESFAETYSLDDRRRIISSGVRHGRAHAIEDVRTVVDVGLWAKLSLSTVAMRGERLVLLHLHAAGPDPGASQSDLLQVVEVDDDGRFSAVVVFDVNDIDAALDELERRYLAGDAAAHAHAWSVIAGAYAAVRRHELPSTTPDWVNVDHRRVTSFAPNELVPFLKATWDVLEDDIQLYVEAVHRLTDIGAVVTRVIKGTSRGGFTAEWREIGLSTVEGNSINRSELFDESDLHTALVRFEELNQPGGLKNRASEVIDRYCAAFGARDWAAMAETLADDVITDDRRRVVNAGVRHGRNVNLADGQAAAEVGAAQDLVSIVIATRGERLLLSRVRTINSNTPPGEIGAQMLGVVVIDSDGRIAVMTIFDDDDLDAALQALETRYLAGEAAVYAHIWSVIVDVFAAVNSHKLPQFAPDWVNVDHRSSVAFAPGEMASYTEAAQEDMPDATLYIEAVHQLNDLGAVVTYVARGTSTEGFQAEWREVSLSTVDGGRVNRSELFDLADLDDALARFDELTRPAPRPANAAYQMVERLWSRFDERDWTAIGELLAPDIDAEDRRRIINDGMRRGREAFVANMRAVAEVGTGDITSTLVATRGQRLVLARVRSERFHTDVLNLVELDAEQHVMTSTVVFDVEDLDAAFVELDSRFGAGEGAPHRRIWTVLAKAFAAFNRHQLPATTPDWVNIDHRSGTPIAPGQLFPYVRTSWQLAPDIINHIEVVHRLTDLGAVVTRVATGTSQDGFTAEWRVITLATFDGDLLSRVELFDEADLDTAIARFEELNRPSPRLTNTATRLEERFRALFKQRDWNAISQLLVDDLNYDDCRRVVGTGLLRGRDAEIANLRATADMGTTTVASTVLATRGQHLALTRVLLHGRNTRPDTYRTEALVLIESSTDNRIAAFVILDADDLDPAFAELDARYLAGEAARYAEVWSGIADSYARFNRHEVPGLSNWVTTDHRVRETFAGDGLAAYLRSGWDVTPNNKMYVECVHRLSDRGAVLTHTAYGNSSDGFYAEWRMVALLTMKGLDGRNHFDLFEEADLDTAIAKFDELSASARRPENEASRALARAWACFDARDWDATRLVMSDDFTSYDRRQVVNAGVRRGRAIHIENMQSVGDVGFENAGSTVIAIRGERLALCQSRFAAGELSGGEVVAEALMIVETDTTNRLVSNTVFDLDDVAVAFADLDAKYASGEAAAHARTWSVVTRAYAALNRHEQFERDWIYTDHRQGTPFASTTSAAATHPDVWDVTPDLSAHIEVVHRLSDAAVLVTSVIGGASHDGFEAEWRLVQLLTVTGDSIERCELFDETDLDTAIARFDELDQPVPRLDNAAVQVRKRVADAYNRRDTETFTAGAVGHYEDRRRGLRDEGVTDAKYAHAVLSETPTSWKVNVEPIAVRGDRLALTRETFLDYDDPTRPITVDLVVLTDVADNEADLHTIFFDPENTDAAFAELDRRFLAGAAAPFARTWSAIVQAFAKFNRRELPELLPIWVDHRLGALIEADDLVANVRAAWELTPDVSVYVPIVHRLSERGAVVDRLVKGHSDKGFPFESRELALVTVDKGHPDRFEMFEEDDLDAALERFDELSQAPPIENAATHFWTVVVGAFNRRDVETVLSLLSVDGCLEDRRSGLRGSFRGLERHRAVEAMFTTAPASWRIEVEPIAVRGSLLALMRQRYRDSATDDGQIVVEILTVTEMRDGTVLHDTVDFDADDITSAMQELESRYVAGEAAPYSRTWTAIAEAFAAFNRREIPSPALAWVDHRVNASIEVGDLTANLRVAWDLAPDVRVQLASVNQLSGVGAVIDGVVTGRPVEGFSFEYRVIAVITVDGDRAIRFEIFDEGDLDTALARFNELNRQTTRVENTATRMWARLADAFNHHDVEGFLAVTSPAGRIDDRRKGLQALHGPTDRRKAALALFESPLSWRTEIEHVATRGARLALARQIYRDTADESRPITVDILTVVEINDDGLMGDFVNFDSDDLDAAFEELETRYLAGEAAAHARTWSAIADGYVSFNGRELFRTTPDWVNIDHRRGGTSFGPGDQINLVKATWDVVPKIHAYAEVVHQLGGPGAVVTQVVTATSREGFDGEWREVVLLTIEGDAISRCEVFDETEIDAALARFDELNRSAHRLANIATRTRASSVDAFDRRDLDAFCSLLTPDGRYDDRRKGLRNEGSLKQEFVPSMLSEAPESWRWTDEPIAIRGERLALCRDWFRDTDAPGQPVVVDDLSLTEVTEDGLVCSSVIFDSDDLDAAMSELDARWIASGEVEHPEIIEAHRTSIAMTNRHEWDALTAVCAGASYINHRQLGSESADYITSIRALASLAPDLSIESAEILAHSAVGVAVHVTVRGTSTEGLAIEVPFVLINLWSGDHVTHIEAFDPEDRDHALTRFQELTASG
nr:BTAD domain-containing putative transcriptional regulator [Mycolicibacterium komanii]